MKKMTAAITAIILFFCSCGAPSDSGQTSPTDIYPAELRACWISYLELDFDDKSESGFKSGIERLLSAAEDCGLNAVFVHTVSHCDAYYRSEVLPMSKYVAGERAGSLDYDPLKLICAAAKKHGLSVHAWINPFRITADSKEFAAFSKDDVAVKMLQSSCASEADNGVYLVPSQPAAQRLILDAVREIINNYDVAGVHFDDYFYPTTSEDFDKLQYEKYKSDAGENALPLDEYRRAAVDGFVSAVYRTVKSADKRLMFGISPQADIKKNRDTLYADVEKWCAVSGYIDYIMPQIYFGFEYPSESFRFDKCLDSWLKLDTSFAQLYVGLGMYRSGDALSANGAQSAEWIKNSDVIARQVQYLRKKNLSGFSVFSCGSLIQKTKEAENLKKVLKE